MTFLTNKIAGIDAISRLQTLRNLYRETGEYPFLIGSADELEQVQQTAEFDRQPFEDIIEQALELDVESWITERREEAEEYELPIEEILGEWPGEVAHKGGISLHLDGLNGKPIPEVFLGVASIKEPWHLPAILNYGGWNDCPEAEVQCAIHRQWKTRFGAEIVGMSGDVVECIVNKPPTDQAIAIELAWQQYWYCADIVDQGCGSISNLAATLINSPYWYFWWD